ncbi:MAG: serpin family protein [Rubricoccaceae bacterium]
MRLACLAILGITVFAGCDAISQETPTDPATITLSSEAEAAVAQSNDFGVRLFDLTAADRDENLMLSPLSASVALTMLLNGSDGDTYTQIRDMLGYSPDQDLDAINAGYQSLRSQLLEADPQVQLALANAVFYRDTFGPSIQPTFLETMRTSFDARIDGLDFADQTASLAEINGWASDNTNGKIPEVLDQLDPALVMLLMNALYFKGDWTTQFDEDDTQDLPFTLSDGSTPQVPTMTGHIEARYLERDGYTAVELPYGRRNFSMIVAVPDESLGDFVDELATGGWTDLTDGLGTDDTWRTVIVSLPRFTFENDENLNEELQALGMTNAFTGRADLTRIANHLRVDFVKQNTFVEVNEEGTEAAAVTTIGIELTSAPSHPIFRADRPFVFAIRERTTNTLLFIGQVTDPR